MLTWDKRWKDHEGEVEQLSDCQRRNLALACIDNALAMMGPRFIKNLPQPVHEAFSDTLKFLWDSPIDVERCKRMRNVVDAHVNDELPSGGYDLLMAQVTLLDTGLEEIDSDALLECLSYAYQAILDAEILSTLEKNMTESEVNRMEEANERCMKCISDQLNALKAISGGARVDRKQLSMS